MGKKCAVFGMLLLCMALAGCGDGKTEGKAEGETKVETEKSGETAALSLEIKKDGSVTETIAEDFSSDYYDAEELKNFILSEVAQFNGGPKEEISVDRFEEKDGFVYVTMTYPSAELYSDYHSGDRSDKLLFFGTVAEAYEAGMDLDVTLRRVKKEEPLGKEALLGMGESHILIAEEPAQVKVFGKIVGASDNVTVTGRKQAVMDRPAEENQTISDRYYIVF